MPHRFRETKQISLRLKTAPTEEPITRAEAKLHLRVDPDLTTDDSLIDALIKAARSSAENFTRRQFITATFELRFDIFPNVIFPLRPPLQSVTEIRYIDTDGNPQVLDPQLFQVDIFSTVGRILPVESESFPDTDEVVSAVTVEYKAGFGLAVSVPDDIKAAMLLTIGHLYEHREDVLVGVTASQLPTGTKDLLFPYRILGELQ